MPSAYTHYRFGQQLLSALPEPVRLSVQRHRRLYDLGLQEPDFFFYYKLGKDTPVKRLAQEYHHRTGKSVFSAICRTLGKPSEEEQAYLHGLLAHYCLDACCHPIVNGITGADSLAHNDMESEFDRFLLACDGVKIPHGYHRGRTVRCSGADAAVIGRFYPEAKPEEIRLGLNTMGIVLGLLTIHAGAKVVLDMMGNPNPGLLMHKSEDPAFGCFNRELQDGYNRAAEQYPVLAQQLQSHMTLGESLGKEFEFIFG